jgi:hypothetical protein
MPKLTEFTPVELKNLRTEIETGLAELGQRLGIAFSVGNARYDTIEADFKLKMTIIGDVDGLSPEEVKEKRVRDEFESNAFMFGLTAEDFGMELTVYGEKFELIGFNLKAPKNRFKGRNERGIFRLPSSEVTPQLKKAS